MIYFITTKLSDRSTIVVRRSSQCIMSRLQLEINSPWGVRSQIVYWADPKMMWKTFVKQVLSAVQLDGVLEDSNGVPVVKFARLQGDKKVALSSKSPYDTLEKVGLGKTEKLFVVQIERPSDVPGDTIVSSDTTFYGDDQSTDNPATQKSEFSSEGPEWRSHSGGLNYEGSCPSQPERRIILPRGYGKFDWADDPVGIMCPCCSKKVDARTITQVAVNNCNWKYDGISDSGEREADEGKATNSIVWLPINNHSWRKLKLEINQLS